MALGGNLDSLRRANLSNVLRIVHRTGGVSRAEITAQLGLNRSTVGALVAELAELGLVVEGPPASPRRLGRPSPVVTPDPRPVVLAINPEVDAVEVALVGLGARVESHLRIPADHVLDPAEAARIVTRVRSKELAPLLRDRRLIAAAVAVPGLVRAADGLVAWAPHLDWRDVPFAAMIERELGVPTVAGNDADAGAIAESLFGAGRGHQQIIYLNGGASGIGGGVIVDGRPLRGKVGFAGEVGHVRVWIADPADRATADSVLEDEVSRARLLAAVGLDSGDDDELGAALRESAGRPAAAREVARQRRVLASALGDLVNVFDPEIIVLGGFLAILAADDPEGFAALVGRGSLPMPFAGVEIVPAALGSDRLLVGAAELGFAALLDNPGLTGPDPTA